MSDTRYSYSGTREAETTSTEKPESVEALAALLTKHARTGGTLLAVGSGHSLDTQGLTTGTTLDLTALPHEVLVDGAGTVVVRRSGEQVPWATCEVTAWTPWDAVVRATLGIDKAPTGWKGKWLDGASSGSDVCARRNAGDKEYMPYVVPSSGRITIGGSLSADTIWRASNIFGKESHSVVWLDLLTFEPDGKRTRVLRLYNPDFKEASPARPAGVVSDAANNDLFFSAVIGGFGLVGVILRAKYLLLELSGVAPELVPVGGQHEELDAEDDTPTEEPEGINPLKTWSDPPYPHTPLAEFGNGGGDRKHRALTAMWSTRDLEALFDSLTGHHYRVWPAVSSRQPLFDRATRSNTVTTFALFFPNLSTSRPKAVFGNVAYGRSHPKPKGFKIWSREYGYRNLPRVVRWLPAGAVIGEHGARIRLFEEVVSRTLHGKGANRWSVNLLPEYALFMEGHAACTYNESRQTDERTKTIQQAFAIPLDDLARAKRDFVEVLAEMNRLSRPHDTGRDAVHIQTCDIKMVPKGHALLSSSPDKASVVITMAVEKGAAYDGTWWGDAEKKLTALSATLHESSGKKIRVHLTKNLFVADSDLKSMYGPQIAKFARVKKVLDKNGVFDSVLWQRLRGLAT